MFCCAFRAFYPRALMRLLSVCWVQCEYFRHRFVLVLLIDALLRHTLANSPGQVTTSQAAGSLLFARGTAVPMQFAGRPNEVLTKKGIAFSRRSRNTGLVDPLTTLLFHSHFQVHTYIKYVHGLAGPPTGAIDSGARESHLAVVT